MSLKELYQSITNQNSNTYLLYGEENYQIEQVLKIAKDTLNPSFSDFNYTVVDTDYDKDIKGLVTKCESVPFMDSKRIVVLKSSDLFSISSAYDSEEIENLVEYITSPVESTVLFLVLPKVDKRSSLYKKINKSCEIFESKRLDKVQLNNFVAEKLSKEKIELDSTSQQYLIKKTGYLYRDSKVSLFDVENEIEKVLLNSKNPSSIDMEQIQESVFSKEEDDKFKFIDAVFSGDLSKSYEMMNAVLDSKTPPILLMALFGRQLSILLKLNVLTKSRLSDNVISKRLSLHPYVVKKSKVFLKKYSFKQLLDLYNICSDMDYRAKTGRINDKICVEIMVGRICSNGAS